MEISKNKEKMIRELIRDNHDGTVYDEQNFKQALASIFKNLEEDSNHDVVSEFIAQYTYHSPKNGGYYFNLKRKQIKKKDEYKELILSSIGKNIDVKQNSDSNDELVSSNSLNDNQSIDIIETKETNDIKEINTFTEIKKEEPVIIDNSLDETIFIKSTSAKKCDSDEPIESEEKIQQVQQIDTKTIISEQLNETKEKKPYSDNDAIDTEEYAELEKKLFDDFKVTKPVQVQPPKQSKWSEKFKKTNISNYSINKTDKIGSYTFPLEKQYKLIQYTDKQHGPYGTQWIHEVQVDDVIDDDVIRKSLQFDKLRAVILPEQRSEEWHAMRNGAITASDGGCVLGVNKNELPHSFLIKKCMKRDFKSNIYCHHGTKFEEVATMIYAYRTNTDIEEFGLMLHPKIKFLGASPDGICSKYKLNKKNKSKLVGKMLEIKCPYIRDDWKSEDAVLIDPDITNKHVVCPYYYWVQVQLQLECCDLDECDFWQCDIAEYKSRQEFIEDTDPDEPFRSKQYGFEKGCIIQLIPKGETNDRSNPNYDQMVYDKSKFIYPTKIEMTPYECDIWISEQLDNLKTDPKYSKYVFDKVIYWKLVFSRSETFLRDRKWFSDSLPIFQKIWNYVLFIRENKMQSNLFSEYICSLQLQDESSKSAKIDKKIMAMVDKLCNPSAHDYDEFILKLKEEISSNNNNIKKVKKITGNLFVNSKIDTDDQTQSYINTEDVKYNNYMFVDYDNDGNVSTNIPIKSGGKISKSNSKPSSYLFTDN